MLMRSSRRWRRWFGSVSPNLSNLKKMAWPLKALPQLGHSPFYHLNSDTIWIDGVKPNLARLAEGFEVNEMDALLLVAPTTSSIGYAGAGDFSMPSLLSQSLLQSRRASRTSSNPIFRSCSPCGSGATAATIISHA